MRESTFIRRTRTRYAACPRFLGFSSLPQFLAKRVDVLQTSRHVRIEVNGVEVANTRRAYFLLETGLRRRTYIPVMDVRYDLLTPSDTTSVCPYKVRIFGSIEPGVLGLIPG